MPKPKSHVRRDRGEAFLPDPADGAAIASDDAESFAEEFIASVTGGEFVLEDARNEETDEEIESLRSETWSGEPDAADDDVTAADA